MQSRWFNAAVVLLWLATMGWLLIIQVLPSIFIGEPPSYGKIIEARRDAPPVGWRMTFNSQPLGWALSDSILQPTSLTEIHSRVHFESFPLEKLLPTWLRSLVKMMHRSSNDLELDTRSLLVIDPLGHLLRFDSSVRIDPMNELINIRGIVEGRELDLTVRSGEASFNHQVSFNSSQMLSDSLSPQTVLPGLHAGQKWTMPVYSPIWPAKNPLEIVYAKVENADPILWDGEMKQCWLVVYESDSGSGTAGKRSLRGKLWVHQEGPVLRQEIYLFDSTIRFERLTDKETNKLIEEVGTQWWDMDQANGAWRLEDAAMPEEKIDHVWDDAPRSDFDQAPPLFHAHPAAEKPAESPPSGTAPHPQDAAQ